MIAYAMAAEHRTTRRRIRTERVWLEHMHDRWHHQRFVDPDPLRFVLRQDNPADQEIAGLVAACLAYGNVKAINASVDQVLTVMGSSPARWLVEQSPAAIRRRYRGFRHRVTSDGQLAGLLVGARSILRHDGSLNERFVHDLGTEDETVEPALGSFVDAVSRTASVGLSHLLPHPDRGSACKRLYLYLRWMVRRDRVDPGPWNGVSPAQLIMPLDTHVQRTALSRGWTSRKTATGAAAREVTAFLRRVRPDDPLRYDFAITRPGIRRAGGALPAGAGTGGAPARAG